MNINIHRVERLETSFTNENDATWLDILVHADGVKYRISLFAVDVEQRKVFEEMLSKLPREV